MYKRFGAIEQSKLLAVATILDPRFKRLHFNNPVACANAVSFINQSIQLHKQHTIDNPLPQQSNISNSNPGSIWTYHEELAMKYAEEKDVRSDLDFEFKMYLNTPTIPLASDPFVYWNTYTSDSLRELAKKYLSVVGTSVPCEKLFSKAGNIITPSRNRLSSEMLTKLLFLYSLNYEDWNL